MGNSLKNLANQKKYLARYVSPGIAFLRRLTTKKQINTQILKEFFESYKVDHELLILNFLLDFKPLKDIL